MTPLQMAMEAAKAMAAPGSQVGLTLTLPKGGMPRGFPRGELLNEFRRNGRIERTYSFDPERVLAWLIANGLVLMERRDDNALVLRAGKEPDHARA